MRNLPKNPKVIFEKYQDPLDDKEVDIAEDDDDSYDDTDEFLPLMGMQRPRAFKMLQTPLGFLSLPEHSLATKNMDFWVFHSNFDITFPMIESLNGLPGVEFLKILTRYRGIVGFGKLFDVEESKKNMENALFHKLEEQQLINTSLPSNKQLNILKDIPVYSKYYAVYTLPNNEVQTVASNEDNAEYREKIAVLQFLHLNIGGIYYDNAEQMD